MNRRTLGFTFHDFQACWLAAGFRAVGRRMVGFSHGSPTFKPVFRKVVG